MSVHARLEVVLVNLIQAKEMASSCEGASLYCDSSCNLGPGLAVGVGVVMLLAEEGCERS